MGYTTKFEGRLNFNKNLPISAISKLKTILGEDCREHPEWSRPDLTYIDLKLTDDLMGVEWDGSEKTYDLVEKVNLIIKLMRQEYPDFELTGEMSAQGEEIDDIWKLKMDSNVAIGVEIHINVDNEKCYIVVCDSWEYNDEYYYQPDSDGYTLHDLKLYTKSEAEQIRDAMNTESSEHLTRWDDDAEEEVKIEPYRIIKLEI